MNSTNTLIAQLEESLEEIASQVDLSIADNAPLLNAGSLQLLRQESDLQQFRKVTGCYFIFTTLARERLPTFRDYRLYDEQYLHVAGQRFGCVYNGKHTDIRSRLRQHLFSSQTVQAVKSGRANRLSATGALSLEAITGQELALLREHYPGCLPASSSGNLIDCARLADVSPKHLKLPDAQLLNGIHIGEPQWAGSMFGVIVIPVASPILQLILEHAFRKQHGWPALSKR